MWPMVRRTASESAYGSETASCVGVDVAGGSA